MAEQLKDDLCRTCWGSPCICNLVITDESEESEDCEHGNPTDTCDECQNKFLEGLENDNARSEQIEQPQASIENGAALRDTGSEQRPATEPQSICADAGKPKTPRSYGEQLKELLTLFRGLGSPEKYDEKDARTSAFGIVREQYGKLGHGVPDSDALNDAKDRWQREHRAKQALEDMGFDSGAKAEEANWYWQHYLADSKITSIVAPTTAALHFVADLAARASRGADWLDGSKGLGKKYPADIVLISKHKQSFASLFEQYGGNPKKLHTLTRFDFSRAADISRGFLQLDQPIHIFHPLEGVNLNDEDAANTTLEVMREYLGGPVLYTVGPSTRSAGTRGRGAPAWTEATDVGLALTEHNGVVKLTRRDGYVTAYRVEAKGLVLTDLPAPEAKSQVDRAAVGLRQFLADGPKFSADVVAWGSTQGFTIRTLERAAKFLDIEPKREKGRIPAKTVWELP